MQLERREKIHEIEFLSLLAFIARESLRVAQDMTMNSRFTQHDLAMAYAYQRQLVKPRTQVPSSYQLSHLPAHSDLVQGVRKSFTDSPLSHYDHPVSTTNDHFIPMLPFHDPPNILLPSSNQRHSEHGIPGTISFLSIEYNVRVL